MIQINFFTRQKETELMVAGGRNSQGVWDGHVHTAKFKMDNQQGPIVQQIELAQCSMAALKEVGVEGEWMHECVWLNPFTMHLKISQHC